MREGDGGEICCCTVHTFAMQTEQKPLLLTYIHTHYIYMAEAKASNNNRAMSMSCLAPVFDVFGSKQILVHSAEP